MWVVWTISCCYPDYHFMNLIGHRDREIIANLYSFCADIYLSCLLLQIISWPKEVIRKLCGSDPARNFRTPSFFFLSQLISSHICCCCECVCVDKSFFPFGQQKFGSTLRHCVAWESGKSVKSGRDVRFFCGAELLCERRRRRRRRHAGCSGLAARANHPQPLGRSWIALPSWRYELIRLYRLLFLFYFFSILKQSSIATKSPSPVFCVVFWAGTDGRKKIIWKREKEEDKKETNKLEKYVL